MKVHTFVLLVAIAASAGCTMFPGTPTKTGNNTTAASLGEIESGYTYIPVDPFPVDVKLGASCKGPDRADATLLDSLPDNAVRMLVERFDKSGAISYGVSKAGIKDQFYRVTVDYINADTINVPVQITKSMKFADTGKYRNVDLFGSNTEGFVPGTERFDVSRVASRAAAKNPDNVFNIPVYVGVGLRVSSFVYVTGATANISGIGIIGAEAEADHLRGSLVVQTLGVNGKSVAAALPIQSELNRTTAQNAIVAVGSIKALLYSPETITSPRVVGLYLPFPGGKALVNALISELSKKPVDWVRACPPRKKPQA